MGADFAAATALISFGAVLGTTTPLQLFVLVILEMVLYSLNNALGTIQYQAIDSGGSMYIHAFGAYFGLAASFALGNVTRDKVSES